MEQIEKLAEELNKRLDAIETKAEDKTEVEALKTELAKVTGEEGIEAIKSEIDKLATKVNQIGDVKKDNQIGKIEIKKNVNKNGNTQRDYEMSATIKADAIHNIAVISGGDFDDDEANMDSGILTITAGSPRFSGRQPSSQVFFETISSLAEPILVGQALQEAIVHDETGTIAVTGEANEKPKIAQKIKIQKVEAKKVPAIWYETTEFINRVGVFGAPFRNNFSVKYVDRLANLLLTDVNGLAATWANPGLDPVADANNYDVLTALASFIEDSKYTPTHVIMNTVDVSNMFTAKAIDGHYSLTNGGSVQVINGGTSLVVNGSTIELIKVDKTLQAVGTVTMFDVNKLRFGLSPSVEMSTNPYKYWEENIVGMKLEGAFAVLLPENHPNAVVSATFATIKTALAPQ